MGGARTEGDLQRVIQFHPSIRYVIAIGKDGRSRLRANAPGSEALEPPEQTDRILERFAIARGMTQASDQFYGGLKTIIVRREKLVELLFPVGDTMILVGATPGFPLERSAELEEYLARTPPT